MKSLFTLACAVVSAVALTLTAAVPQLLNYQGQLYTSGGQPANDTFAMVFTIYDASTGGNLKWTELQPTVVVTNGSFSVLLGSVTPIADSVFKDTVRYLGVTVGGDPEMTPRIRLVSVGYSMRVSTVEGASGGTIVSDLTVTGKAGFGPNQNTGDYSFTAGSGNVSGGPNTVACGGNNQALNQGDVVAGGQNNIASGSFSTVSGGSTNSATGHQATVAGGVSNRAIGNYSSVLGGKGASATGDFSVAVGGGGFFPTDSIAAAGHYSFVGGGRRNRAFGRYSVLSGGGGDNDADSNVALGDGSVLSGGSRNLSAGYYAVVSGGYSNTAIGSYSSALGGSSNGSGGNHSCVSGGESNSANGQWSTVLGGKGNSAAGDLALAAGHRAKAVQYGTFVWGDSSDSDFASTAPNQFLIRAKGGVGIGTNNPTAALEVAGTVYSTNGGFRFPDGTTQTTAASGGGAFLPLTGGIMIGPITSTGNPSITMGKGNFGSGNTNSGDNAFVAGLGNSAISQGSVVSGGGHNTASGLFSTVGGGGGSLTTYGNTASGDYSTISGGVANRSSGPISTIGGGQSCLASGTYATVGGGYADTATGRASVVTGGENNSAKGDWSFAGGHQAKANNLGSFVWADGTAADFSSTGNNQFLIRANGGVGINTSYPTAPLQVAGIIYSSSDGFKFPDGTIQTTAAGGAGGNADMVDGFHASSTPGPNRLLALDANSNFVVTGSSTTAIIKGASTSGPGVHGVSDESIGVFGECLGTGNPSATAYGIRGYARNAFTGDVVGGDFAAQSGGSGNHYGLTAWSSASSAGLSRGVHAQASNSGSGPVYGGHFEATSAGTGSHYGLYTASSASSATTARGAYVLSTNTGSGDVIGADIVAQTGGTGNHYGITAYADANNTNVTRGVLSSAGNLGSGQVIGGDFYAKSGGTGDHFGIAAASDASNASLSRGVYSYASNLGTGIVVGGRFDAKTGGTGLHYGAFCAASGGSDAIGIFATASGGSTTTYAGYFSGNVGVTGTIYAGTKSFRIDHPVHPEDMYLQHVSVESPDMKNVYDGVVQLGANGEATVTLPDYFEALNRDLRYQLTCIGGFAPIYVAEKVNGNRFKIAGGTPGLEVSWQVTGVRQDKYAEANRIQVEVNKQPEEQGKYLYPELYGQPKERGLNYDKEVMAREQQERANPLQEEKRP